MAREFLKKDKICLVCGTAIKATGKVNTCGGACRIKLARLKKEDKKPEYTLIAKTSGQQLPDWIAVKLKEVGQNSTQNKKMVNPADDKESPKTETKPMSYQDKLFRIKMGYKD